LEKVIQAKIAGQKVVAPAVHTTSQVVNLMDALKNSLDAVSIGKKRPAKASPERPSQKRKRAS
jgi:non-homologous end joining protein Ku